MARDTVLVGIVRMSGAKSARKPAKAAETNLHVLSAQSRVTGATR